MDKMGKSHTDLRVVRSRPGEERPVGRPRHRWLDNVVQTFVVWG